MSKKWGGGQCTPTFKSGRGEGSCPRPPSPTPVSGHPKVPVTKICPYLRIQYKCIGYNRPHPLYCPQFLQDQHKIERISCPVEGGARITGVVYCGKLLCIPYAAGQYRCQSCISGIKGDGIHSEDFG